MTNSLQPKKSAKLARAILIAGFIGLLWLPSLDGIFHWDQTPEVNENRALAPLPHFHFGSSVGSFISDWEAWYDDHFGFRKRLIYWERTWKRRWFGESPSDIVIIGRKGWLYYAPGDRKEDFRQPTLFTTQQLESWRSLFEGRRDWLARRGIAYAVVFAPDKQSVYPEYLPEGRVKPGTTKLDQLLAYLKANSPVETLDLRPSLIQAKTNGLTYLRTDSHWNQYGAWVTCRQIVELLASQMPGLKPLAMDSFERTFASEPGGDLAVLLAAASTMRENDYVTLTPRPPLPVLSVTRKYEKIGIVQRVENPRQQGSAIIFGDSFAEGWFPFLGYTFGKVTLYRLYDSLPASLGQRAPLVAHIWKPALIEQDKPNVVIDEIVEELLAREDPAFTQQVDGLK